MFRCCCVRTSPDVLLMDTRNVKPIRFTEKQLLKLYFDNSKNVRFQQLQRIKTCPSGELILQLWKEELVQENIHKQQVYKTIIQILNDPNDPVEEAVKQSQLLQIQICTKLKKNLFSLNPKHIQAFVSLLSDENTQNLCKGLCVSGIKIIKRYFSKSQQQACEHIYEEKKQQNKKHDAAMVYFAHPSFDGLLDF